LKKLTFDEVKLINIIGCIHYISDLESLSFLHHRYLTTHTTKVRDKKLCCFGYQEKSLLGHESVVLIFLAQLLHLTEWKLHELSYREWVDLVKNRLYFSYYSFPLHLQPLHHSPQYFVIYFIVIITMPPLFFELFLNTSIFDPMVIHSIF